MGRHLEAGEANPPYLARPHIEKEPNGGRVVVLDGDGTLWENNIFLPCAFSQNRTRPKLLSDEGLTNLLTEGFAYRNFDDPYTADNPDRYAIHVYNNLNLWTGGLKRKKYDDISRHAGKFVDTELELAPWTPSILSILRSDASKINMVTALPDFLAMQIWRKLRLNGEIAFSISGVDEKGYLNGRARPLAFGQQRIRLVQHFIDKHGRPGSIVSGDTPVDVEMGAAAEHFVLSPYASEGTVAYALSASQKNPDTHYYTPRNEEEMEAVFRRIITDFPGPERNLALQSS